MKSLIRALARLPRRRLKLLIRAGALEAKVQALDVRLAAVRRARTTLDAQEARIERKLSAVGRKLAALLQGAAPRGRGPGRPPKRRGPGRPPGRRGPGRPPGSGSGRGKRLKNKAPLAQVLRDVLAKKGQALAVAEISDLARANGYRTKSKPAIFAITVSLALRKNPQWFTRVGRKYQLSKKAN